MAIPESPTPVGEQALRERITQLERELATARRRLRSLEDLDRVYTDFVLAVSHELRTPLTVISGYAQKLLLRWSEADEQRRLGMVEKINVSSRRLSRLIDDMLLIADVESGDLTMHMKRVDIHAVVSAALTELADRYPERAPLPRVDEGVAQPAHPEAALVRADGFRLEQVLLCLLDNAVKHSPAHEPVTLTWRKEEEGACVVIAVADRAGGIDPADESRIFSRFSRLQRTIGQRHGGIGVGLYIARHLTEAMGGSIWVESRLGEGSTFFVSLPVDVE